MRAWAGRPLCRKPLPALGSLPGVFGPRSQRPVPGVDGGGQLTPSPGMEFCLGASTSIPLLPGPGDGRTHLLTTCLCLLGGQRQAAAHSCVCPWEVARTLAQQGSAGCSWAALGMSPKTGPSAARDRRKPSSSETLPHPQAVPRPKVLCESWLPSSAPSRGGGRNLSWLWCPVLWSLIFRAPVGLLTSAAGRAAPVFITTLPGRLSP